MKIKDIKMIDVNDWDNLVKETYKKPYSFQQQDGCKERGIVRFSVPDNSYDEEQHDSIVEVINHEEQMGVKFKTWLERDPNQPLNCTEKEAKDSGYYWGKTKEELEEWQKDKTHLNLFYERNFYPEFQTIANDLHSKGLIEEGEYYINIDW